MATDNQIASDPTLVIDFGNTNPINLNLSGTDANRRIKSGAADAGNADYGDMKALIYYITANQLSGEKIIKIWLYNY